jgi:hypothetical protein
VGEWLTARVLSRGVSVFTHTVPPGAGVGGDRASRR